MERIQSLDGLRAVSILCVIAGHLALSTGIFRHAAILGFLGVKVFFVISGFLITSLLQKEVDSTQTISLQSFYKRRALRIFPLAYFYIGTVAVLSIAGVVILNRNDLISAIFYTMSYHQLTAAKPLIHLWSLSVEEQFYFLWPPVIAFAGIRRSRWAAIGVTVGMPVARAMLWLLFPEKHYLFNLQMLSSLDAIAIGCLGALWNDRLSAYAARIRDWAMLVLSALLVIVIAYPLESLPIVLRRCWRGGQDTVAHCIILVLLFGAVYSRGVLFRILNCKPMVWIGVLSYSLYIWQELFVMDSRIPSATAVVITFATAWLAHALIEKPFLRLKHRYELRPRQAAAPA